MWLGSKGVTVVPLLVVAFVALASPARAPIAGSSLQNAAKTLPQTSCKPLPPLTIDAAPTDGAANRWNLTLRSLDEARDVVVWMGTAPDNRRAVWRGNLSTAATSIEVHYIAPANAAQVHVSLEPAGVRSSGQATVRGYAVADIPGRAHLLSKSEGRMITNPDTGVRVRQFTGLLGGAR